MLGGSASFRAKQFVTEANKSTMVYEVKRVRAVWDPSLSIPGTDRRGGWRCPEGTRYGGQITDRFGRQCGWGLVRRIANMVSNVGEALEDRDDRRRERRGGKRRVVSPITPELDTPNLDLNENDSALAESLGEVIPTPEPPKARTVKPRRVTNVDTPEAVEPKPEPRPRRAPRRRPQGNLRPSEQRRMERELEQPGAPRTGLEEPSVEQVLTPEQAADAVPTEEFRPYVLRKYNEYARNVRKIREEGGDAGMLTRREWYALNKDNLRSAWKDVHGTDAPDSFEPPTPQPRRPRRRRQRAVEEAASTRSPSLRNDKEPVAVEPKPEPKTPSRPKKPSSIRPTGAQDKPRRPVPPIPADWVPDGDNRWRWGNWYVTSYADENGNFVRFSAWTSNNKYAEGASVDELIEAMRKPKVFESLNEALNEIGFDDFFNNEVFGLRTEILNDPSHFPVLDRMKRDVAERAIANMREIQGIKDVLNRALAENRVSNDDMVKVRGAIELTMDELILNLDATQEAWKFVRDSNTNLPQQREFQLDGGWNKIGENKWEKGGIELQLGFVNGEVVSGQIKNTVSGEIFEQEFRADQSRVQNFVDNLYAMIGGPTFPSIVPPNAKKKPQLRKGRKPISEETKRLLAQAGNLHHFNIHRDGQPAMVYGVGYRNAYEVALAHTERIKEQIALHNNARMGHITQARDGIVGYNERLAFIQEAADTAGLTDDDYFILQDNTTISIGEIKSNIIKAKEEVQRRFEFVRDIYWGARGADGIMAASVLERALGRDFWDHGYQTREQFIAYMATHDYPDFKNLLNLRFDHADPAALDFLRLQSELPASERDYERIYMNIQALGEKEHQYAYFSIEDSELSEVLGLPNDFDYETITGLDEAISIAESKDLDISTQLAAVARKLTREQTTNERNQLMADFIRLDSERFYFKAIAKKLKDKKSPILEQQRLEQASIDRDLAISNLEIDSDLNPENPTSVMNLVDQINVLLQNARGRGRNDDFRNPAWHFGDASGEIEQLYSGRPETEQLEIAKTLLDDISIDKQTKVLNDAIEKFKISPTRKNLSEVKKQSIEQLRTIAKVKTLQQRIEFLTAPHHLDLTRVGALANFIENDDQYNAIADYLNLIFQLDFDRYGSELVKPSDVSGAIRGRRAEIREEFNKIPNSPLGVEKMEEMYLNQVNKVEELKSDFLQVANELQNFVSSGDQQADRERVQEIAVRLSQSARNIAVGKLELEEIKRETHSKRSAIANRPIPTNPLHVLFGGKPEDHENGVNLDNVTERINSVAGEISDRRISKYINDLDTAFRQLQQFDDNEIIRFNTGDVSVADAKRAIQEASSAYQEIKNARINNPEQAVFTPRISDKGDLTDSELAIQPLSQEVHEIPETVKALLNNLIDRVDNDETMRDARLLLDAYIIRANVVQVNDLANFVSELNNFITGLGIDGKKSDMPRDDWQNILARVDDYLKTSGGVGISDIDDFNTETGAIIARRNNVLDQINQLDADLSNNLITQDEFDRRLYVLLESYADYDKKIKNRQDRVNIFNWAQREVPKLIESKGRGIKMSEGDIDTPLTDDEVENLNGKIKKQIKKAIARRLDVLQNYINNRYPRGDRPWDITPDEWNDLDKSDKEDYIREAYSHEFIEGANGRYYSAVVQDLSSNRDGNLFEVYVTFYEVDDEGNQLRVAGTSRREVNIADGHVYNATMFLDQSPVDKGAGIQTIYNQHAFMYLKSIGVKKAKVQAADDGPYVWARIGFIQSGKIPQNKIQRMRDALDRYKNIGPVGIIQNDGEYRRLEALVKLWEQDKPISYQDFIFAFDEPKDKFGALRLREWFKTNMPLDYGNLDFSDNDVSRNPGDRAQELLDFAKE